MKKPSKSERESPWYKYGTDKDYQAWCRTQPCAVTKVTTDIIYAHNRNAKNAGTGYKPPFSGIPMNYFVHLDQHKVAQYAFMSRDRWEFLCQLHLEKWRNSVTGE